MVLNVNRNHKVCSGQGNWREGGMVMGEECFSSKMFFRFALYIFTMCSLLTGM